MLRNKTLYSPLAGQSRLKPSGRGARRAIHASLLLTSLVDAFSILVIFLMMNSATDSSDVDAGKDISLPKAVSGIASQKVTVVKVVKGQFFINDSAVSQNMLDDVLTDIHQDLTKKELPTADSLLILADREMNYGELNPIIVHGSRAGFSELRFAVVKE